MIIAIAYQQEMALLLSACVTLVVVVSLGHGLAAGAGVERDGRRAPSSCCEQVRTRSKLLLVGFAAAAVGFLTTLGVGTLYGQAVVDAAGRTASPSPCGRSSPAR